MRAVGAGLVDMLGLLSFWCGNAIPHAIAPGPLMIGLGLLSLIFAAFMLYRRRDIKRLFAYSSIEHMGIIVFAFGMAGPLGNFAGLLQMTMHSLTKSAIFFSVGHIAQVKGSQRIADIGGLTETHPTLGWGLVAGVVAIIGLPPFGVFTSEFLVVSSTFSREPVLAVLGSVMRSRFPSPLKSSATKIGSEGKAGVLGGVPLKASPPGAANVPSPFPIDRPKALAISSLASLCVSAAWAATLMPSAKPAAAVKSSARRARAIRIRVFAVAASMRLEASVVRSGQ